VSCIITTDCNITEDSPGVWCPVTLTYTVEEDTYENKENLKNVKELVEEFEREYEKEVKELR